MRQWKQVAVDRWECVKYVASLAAIGDEFYDADVRAAISRMKNAEASGINYADIYRHSDDGDNRLLAAALLRIHARAKEPKADPPSDMNVLAARIAAAGYTMMVQYNHTVRGWVVFCIGEDKADHAVAHTLEEAMRTVIQLLGI